MAIEFSRAFDPFRALKAGVHSLKTEPAPVFVGGLLLFLVQSCKGVGNQMPNPSSGGSSWDSGDDPFSSGGNPFDGVDETMIIFAMVMLGIGCCVGLFVFAVQAFLQPGMYRVGERMTIDGTSGIDVLFSGKDVWLSMMGYKLLSGAIGLGIFTVFASPGGLVIAGAVVAGDGGPPNTALLVLGAMLIVALVMPALLYVMLGLGFGQVAISLDRLGAMEALDRSWTLAKGNRFRLLLFGFVNGIFGAVAAFVGLMLCCVGLLATGPAATGVVVCAQANAWLMLTREGHEDFFMVRELGVD